MGKSLADHLRRGEMDPQDRAPDITMINAITINEITMESDDIERTCYNIMNKKDLEVEVQTIYKRKDKKDSLGQHTFSNGVNPGGNVMSEETGNTSLEGEMRNGGKKVPRGL